MKAETMTVMDHVWMPEKTPSMVRNLRAIFARARLTDQEVSTLRGVVTALSRGRGRVLEKLARQKAERGE